MYGLLMFNGAPGLPPATALPLQASAVPQQGGAAAFVHLPKGYTAGSADDDSVLMFGIERTELRHALLPVVAAPGGPLSPAAARPTPPPRSAPKPEPELEPKPKPKSKSKTKPVVAWKLHVHVIACDSPEVLATQLRQLNKARYPPHLKVGVWVNVDSCGSPDVETVATAYHWQGSPLALGLHVDINSEMTLDKKGAQNMWFNAFGHESTRAAMNTMLLILDADKVVSPYYAMYLDGLIQEYWTADGPIDRQLVGHSMGPVDAAGWDHPQSDTEKTAFLAAVAATNAPMYWSKLATPFLAYADERTRHDAAEEPAQAAASDAALLPPALAARAKKNANRFQKRMDEFMFGHGLLMTFPNFADGTAYAALSERAAGSLRMAQAETPPPLEGLAVFDQRLAPAVRAELHSAGARFVRSLPKEYVVLQEMWDATAVAAHCVLDDFVGTAAATRGGTTKYLVFEPQYGLNNQLLAIDHAVAAAKALGRTLIVPPLMVPRASDPNAHSVKFSSVFDVYAGMAEDWTGWANLTGAAPPRAVVQAEELRDYDELSRTLSARAAGGSAALPGVRVAPRMSKAVLMKLFGQCADDVLLFDGMFTQFLLGAGTNPSLNAFSQGVYDKLQAAMQPRLPRGNYTCLHVRNGDFDRVCADIRDKVAPEWFQRQYQQGFKCTVTPKDVFAETRGGHVLVLSPEPVDGLTALPGIVPGSELCETVKALTTGLSAGDQDMLCVVLEQQLCADAARAVVSQFSTFSRRIMALRGSKANTKLWRWKGGRGRRAPRRRHEKAVPRREEEAGAAGPREKEWAAMRERYSVPVSSAGRG